jgi:MarR family transcriptional regulator, lower aerobic nicotinate degradation pathway regulator
MEQHAARQPDPPQRLLRLPSWLLAQGAGHAQRLVADALAGHGMRRHHFAALAALHEQGPSSQVVLGRRLALDPSDLNAVLNDLEQRGLVERVRDAQDRRRKVVGLTDAGEGALAELGARVDAAQDTLLGALTDSERHQLVSLLTRLHDHNRGRGTVPAREQDEGGGGGEGEPGPGAVPNRR